MVERSSKPRTLTQTARTGRRVAIAVLRAIDWILQHVIPPHPRQVAWMSDPDYTGNAHHLYRRMLGTYPDHRHVWLVREPSAAARIRSDLDRWPIDGEAGARVRVVHRRRPSGYWAYLRSTVVYHTHGVYPWVRRAIRRECVSLWHGMPIKVVDALDLNSHKPPAYGSLHLATSPFFRLVIAASFRCLPNRVLLTRLPRCDVLHAPSEFTPPRESVRATLQVPPGRPLVLWLPTFRAGLRHGMRLDAAPSRTFLDDITTQQLASLDQEAAAHECAVVIKLHPYDVLNADVRDLGLSHVRLLTAGAWDDTGLELYDVLSHVDGLISDISSVVVDWLPTGRPMGVLGFDPASYTRHLVFDPSLLTRSARVHDLTRAGAMQRFFADVQTGVRADPAQDELSAWLHPMDLPDGATTILGAVHGATDARRPVTAE